MNHSPRIVMVEWLDSNTTGDGWRDLADIVRVGAKGVKDPCFSVGFLIHEDAMCVVLVPHLAGYPTSDTMPGSGDMTIPRAAITRLVYADGITLPD